MPVEVYLNFNGNCREAVLFYAHVFETEEPQIMAFGDAPLLSTDENKLRSWFSQLKEGGTVIMDLQETFWSKCYGNLRDQFGIEWQFNLE